MHTLGYQARVGREEGLPLWVCLAAKDPASGYALADIFDRGANTILRSRFNPCYSPDWPARFSKLMNKRRRLTRRDSV
jgi:hypothetical protein